MHALVRHRRALAIISVLGLIVLAWAGAYAGTSLVVARDLPDPEAYFILGSHEWERLPVAAQLAREHPGSLVLLSQPVHPNKFNCHLCSERVAWLEHLGIARDRIVLLPRLVTNTYDEAVASREYCKTHGITRLMVVTSPYHTRRTAATFAAVFAGSQTAIGVHPAAETSPARPELWWARPYDRAYVRYEWAAIAWYALRHHVSPWPPD
jgi:uncharacterized SAM-binding protein YcdF (DUF218 family)